MENFNGEINGVNTAFVKQNESLYNTTESAIQELIDNSVDAQSSIINIEINNNKFVIKDNSETGISYDILREIANEMTLNSVEHHKYNKNKRIGKFGGGLHNALLKLSNNTEKSYIKIISRNNFFECCIDKNCVNKKEKGFFVERNIGETEYFVQGTIIEVINPRDISTNALKEVCKKAYARFGDKIKITINNEEVVLYDKCYLNKLGDKINEDGKYVNGWVTHIVESVDYNGHRIPIVGVYVNTENEDFQQYNNHHNKIDGPSNSNNGLYISYCDKFITYGSNATSQVELSANRGGSGRKRFFFDCYEIADEIGISVNKSREISPLYLNDNFIIKKIVEIIKRLNTELDKIHTNKDKSFNTKTSDFSIDDIFSKEDKNVDFTTTYEYSINCDKDENKLIIKEEKTDNNHYIKLVFNKNFYDFKMFMIEEYIKIYCSLGCSVKKVNNFVKIKRVCENNLKRNYIVIKASENNNLQIAI